MIGYLCILFLPWAVTYIQTVTAAGPGWSVVTLAKCSIYLGHQKQKTRGKHQKQKNKNSKLVMAAEDAFDSCSSVDFALVDLQVQDLDSSILDSSFLDSEDDSPLKFSDKDPFSDLDLEDAFAEPKHETIHPTNHKKSSPGKVITRHSIEQHAVETNTACKNTGRFRLSLAEDWKLCEIVHKWTKNQPEWQIRYNKEVKASKLSFLCVANKTKRKGVVGIDCPECLAKLKAKRLQKLCQQCSAFIDQGKEQVRTYACIFARETGQRASDEKAYFSQTINLPQSCSLQHEKRAKNGKFVFRTDARNPYQECEVLSYEPMKIRYAEKLTIKYKLKDQEAKCPGCEEWQRLQKDPNHPHNMLLK